MMQAEEQPALTPRLIPLGDMVALRPTKRERTESVLEGGIVMDLRESAGGILLPDSIDAEPMEGTVVALGDGRREPISLALAMRLAEEVLDEWESQRSVADRFIAASAEPIPFEVKVGDVVTFVPWMATSIKPPGSDAEYWLVAERDIIGIVVPG